LSELTLKYEQESLNGKPVEMLSIEARSSSEFETCLYLGLLQLLLKGRAMRRCEQCGELFYAEQRRVKGGSATSSAKMPIPMKGVAANTNSLPGSLP